MTKDSNKRNPRSRNWGVSSGASGAPQRRRRPQYDEVISSDSTGTQRRRRPAGSGGGASGTQRRRRPQDGTGTSAARGSSARNSSTGSASGSSQQRRRRPVSENAKRASAAGAASGAQRKPRPKSQSTAREAGLRDLLSPSYEEAKAGVQGITLKHEVVSETELKARKRRTVAIMSTAISIFSIMVVVLLTIAIIKAEPFKKRDFSGNGNGVQVTFVVHEGDTSAMVAQNLKNEGIIADADYFLDVYEKESKGKFLIPDEYDLQKEMSSSAVVAQLVGSDNIIYFAVQQGKRTSEVFETISKTTNISKNEFEDAVKNPADYGVPSQFPSIEGWLHPGEYRFPKGTPVKDMIQKMVDKTKKDLQEAGVTDNQKMFEVLTKASIVELEAQPKDYKDVAAIIENRLEHKDGETKGFIQSDATVTYGLGKRSYHLTEEEKADKNNKYNTYANQGLPAGPIDSPTEKSIRAVTDHEKNPYYYWVTVNLDSGETKYAKTYEEHQKYVEEYNQWCSDHKGRCS